MTEAAIIASIQAELNHRGAWYVNIHGRGVGRNGVPDLIAIYRGVPLALEVKTPTGRPTRLQLRELRLAAGAGAIAKVVRSRAEVAQLLDDIETAVAVAA